MADVSRAVERGQMLVVAALALALIFVALALYLNTAIYTENLATRKSDIVGANDAARYKVASAEATRQSMRYVNTHNNTTYADLHENVSDDVGVYSNGSAALAASRGRSANVSLASTTNGTRIVQKPERNLTNVSGDTDWMLVEDVDRTRNYELTVTGNNTLLPCGFAALVPNCTAVVLEDDSGDTWRVLFNQTVTGDPIEVVVENSTGQHSCGTFDYPVTVDLTDGTVNGTECEHLRYGEGVNSVYNVSYKEGERLNATYELTVDETVGSIDGSDYGAEGSTDHPYLTEAVYAARIEVNYATERVRYATVVRIAPGEPDE